jgi:hypothetical protein
LWSHVHRAALMSSRRGRREGDVESRAEDELASSNADTMVRPFPFFICPANRMRDNPENFVGASPVLRAVISVTIWRRCRRKDQRRQREETRDH